MRLVDRPVDLFVTLVVLSKACASICGSWRVLCEGLLERHLHSLGWPVGRFGKCVGLVGKPAGFLGGLHGTLVGMGLFGRLAGLLGKPVGFLLGSV